jgi:nucleoside 2-deoxyribosyltransferase
MCTVLKSAGHEVYDFKNPVPGNHGFHWSSIDPNYQDELTKPETYLKAIEHPIAEEGFQFDFQSLQKADACILILPSGRSAHLELGYAVGQGKKTAIVNPDDDNNVVPELMYKMVDKLFFGSHSFHPLLNWLGE